jgi:hypothetical protein
MLFLLALLRVQYGYRNKAKLAKLSDDPSKHAEEAER